MHSRVRQIGTASSRVDRRPNATRNLVLVHEPFVQDRADLEAIARVIHAIASDIEVFVVSNDTPSSTSRKQSSRRPTLVYSPTELRGFQPLRGKVYAGCLIAKDLQLQRMSEAGIPVPDFAVLRGDYRVDPVHFGAIAILKPIGSSSHGRGMALARTAQLSGTNWRTHPLIRAAADVPMMIQRFIDTGPYPSHYRILTLFGEPIFGFRAISTVLRPSLDACDEVLAAGPLMAKHGQRRLIVPVEQDVLDLARRTFDAIPETALHGCDIIRESDTGKLFVLEINPGGNTWSFSSGWAELLRRELNTRDLTLQFDAWTTCARALIERTRSEAL
jgi:hypothetical protein